MAIFTMKKLKEMSVDERFERLQELQLELSKELATSEIGGSVKSPGRIREIKKTIARFRTLDSENRGDVKQ